MSTHLLEALARLEQELADVGAPIAAAFRGGADARAIRDTLAAEGLAPHADVVTWWAWHDGAEDDGREVESGPGMYLSGENMLVAPWHMLTLAAALRTRRWYLDLFSGDDVLPASWIPIATTDGAGELCADTADTRGSAPLHVVDPETMFERRPPQFESLLEFVTLLVRVLDEGLAVPDTVYPRARMVDFPRLPQELRRLATW